MFYLIYFILILLLSLFLIINKIKNKYNLDKLFKILTIIMLALKLLSSFLPDRLAMPIEESPSQEKDQLLILFRWFNDVSIISLFVVSFYNKAYFNKLNAYFILPVTLITVLLYYCYLPTFLSGNGLGNSEIFNGSLHSFLTNIVFRSIFFGLSMFIQMTISIYYFIKNIRNIRFKNIKEIGIYLIVLLTLLVTIFPIYGFEHFFGYSSLILKPYTIGHLLWVIEIIIEVIVICKVMKKRSYEDIRIMLFVLSLTLIYHYFQMFNIVGSIKVKFYPLQLCNIAGPIILLMLICKNKRIYNFILVSQVLGAFIAIATLNIDNNGIFNPWNIHYIVEHQNIIVIPLVIYNLRLMPRLDKKALKDAIVGFSIYFIIVLVLGWLFESLYLKTGLEYYYVNFFFMFDKMKAIKFLPFVEILFDIRIDITSYWSIKLIQLLIYLSFLMFLTLTFFILYLCEKKRRTNNI